MSDLEADTTSNRPIAIRYICTANNFWCYPYPVEEMRARALRHFAEAFERIAAGAAEKRKEP